MKNILVTGAGGFIGSHLVELLVEKGFGVKAFLRYNSNNNWGWLENYQFKKDLEVISGDIRDYDSVYYAMKGCQEVYHLAALIGIPYSYISPLAYLRTNIEGTYNVLQSSKNLGLTNVLITSTSEVYGTAQYIPIDENHPQVGQSPYSATKIAADQLAISYYRSYNLPVKIVRPFNTFGPRQSARAIIPTIISQAISMNHLELGNLKPTRDLTYVKDTVNGFLAIAKTDDLIGEVTNIGMNEEISIGELSKIILELINIKLDININKNRKRPVISEVERLRCDNTKIISTTGWEPKYNLKRGLLDTINWLKENNQYYKSELYNV